VGRDGVAERVERCMTLAEHLAALVARDDRFELHSQPTTGVVAWRPRCTQPADVQARMSGAFASLTQLDGEMWLRSVCVNPHGDVERLVDAAVQALPRM